MDSGVGWQTRTLNVHSNLAQTCGLSKPPPRDRTERPLVTTLVQRVRRSCRAFGARAPRVPSILVGPRRSSVLLQVGRPMMLCTNLQSSRRAEEHRCAVCAAATREHVRSAQVGTSILLSAVVSSTLSRVVRSCQHHWTLTARAASARERAHRAPRGHVALREPAATTQQRGEHAAPDAPSRPSIGKSRGGYSFMFPAFVTGLPRRGSQAQFSSQARGGGRAPRADAPHAAYTVRWSHLYNRIATRSV